MFRFTIRDVLWLMAVVGLAIALTIQYRKATLTEMAWHYWEQRCNDLERLRRPTAIQCQLMPLRDVAQFLSDQHRLPVVLAPGVDGETQITYSARNISLWEVLETMLRPHNLDFRVKEGGVVIEPKTSTDNETRR